MIYLDHNATTPIAPAVREAIRPYLDGTFGNPSSAHGYGAAAAEAVQRARAEIAALLGCEPEAIVFTGSGSEADNLAIKGVALARLGEGDHLITSAVEHPAVLAACHYREPRLGYRVTGVPVDSYGVVDPDDVRRAIEPRTVLISVMRAKMYAPKGIGALFVRPGTRIDSVIHGAGHEHGLRAGTENVPYIVGLGAAATLAAHRLRAGAQLEVQRLRDRLHATLEAAVPGLLLNGHPEQRLPNTLNVSFPGCDGETLLARTPSIAAAAALGAAAVRQVAA